MTQGALISDLQIHQQTIQRGGISGVFIKYDDERYDVELTINGLKFFCSYSLGMGGIESFEVIASKGVSVITKKLIVLLKETTLHLSYRI